MSSAQPKRIRVLVVDDSALVRKAITDALSLDPDIEVVGSACDPYVAREKIMRLDPDVLTLDLEMPRMDGLTFLRILMEHHPLPVVVVSSLTQAGSQAALDAMEAGAVDVLAKPDGTMSVGALAGQLAYHVKAAAASGRFCDLARRRRSAPPTGSAPESSVSASVAPVRAPALPPAPLPPPHTGRIDPRQLIVIGASTGGVEALRTVLPMLPTGLPPIAVVQHISPYFSKAVATRLDSLSALDVREASDGLVLTSGMCVIAPGDHHLTVVWTGGSYRARILQSPPIHHCRPSVDVLFRSAAETAGPYTIAALLTGMGSDGALGMQAIRRAGGRTIAEHEKTCVVYGMPRAAVQAGAVEQVLPLPQIAEAIVQAVSARRPTGTTF
ncbi:MAG: chemotaxis response regulator protein-glutamate methylesterase [Planctomycetota bacterium]|nr:MAG: chemotaxis response regulator protein-glutamate methylesterase [Planctomycetota bacterium]